MPKLEGIDLLRVIRAHPDAEIHATRFVMIAGSDEKYRRSMESGADSILTKPFTTNSLRKKIEFGFRHGASYGAARGRALRDVRILYRGGGRRGCLHPER